MINTMVADIFEEFSDRLEKSENREEEITAIIRETVKNHKRILFDGDGYSKEWEIEAEKRGLLNLRSTVDAIPLLSSDKNIKMFEHHGVLNRTEIYCRSDIALENYCKILHIEALTLIEMIKRDIIPAVSSYVSVLCDEAAKKHRMGFKGKFVEAKIAKLLDANNSNIYNFVDKLEKAVEKANSTDELLESAKIYHDEVLFLMENIRKCADECEEITSREYWPYPSYGDLLFKI